jgi:hypothetical protein
MAKATTKRQQLQAASPPQPGPAHPLGYDPTGKIEQVDIVGSKDGWSEYTLNDGTVLRVKAAVFDVKSAVGQYAPDGDPIYLVQSAMVIQVKAPESLKRKK